MNTKTNSMMKKRNRNEMMSETSSVNMSSLGQTSFVRNTRKEKLPSKGPFYNENYDKLVTLISEEKCFCHEPISNSAPYEYCNNCFRLFHSMCIKDQTSIFHQPSKENENLTEIVDENLDANVNMEILNYICPFCDNKLKENCNVCFTKIKEQNLKIDCELCGINFHFTCINLPLNFVYNRKLYENCFNNESDFNLFIEKLNTLEITFKNEENQIQLLKQILLKYFTDENLVKLFLNPFTICKFCLISNHYTIQSLNQIQIKEDQMIQEIVIENLSQVHRQFINSSDSFLIKESLENKFTYKNNLSRLIDFYSTNNTKDGFYLVKWKKDNTNYSLENSNFIDKILSVDPEILNNFNIKKIRENEFYTEYYKNENKSIVKSSSIFSQIIQQIRKVYFDEDVEKNKILNELENNNLYFMKDTNSIDEMRESILSNFILCCVQVMKNNSTSSVNNPKILICCDDSSNLKKWENHFAPYNNEINIIKMKYNRRFQTLFYELFYMDLKKIKNLRKLDLDLFLKDNIDEKVDKFFKFLDNSMLDYNMTKFDILLIEKKAYWFSYANVFSKINFDLKIMDFKQSDSIVNLKDILIDEYDKLNNKMIIMSSINIDENTQKNSDFHFSNILDLFYNPSDWLIDNNQNKLKSLSKKIKYFSKNYQDLIKLVRNEYNFTIFNEISKYDLTNDHFYVSAREKSFMECDINNPKVILNFIPVSLSKTDFLQYISILKERKKSVLDKRSENKNDIIKNLMTFCSFPSLMVVYYRNKLQEINLAISDNSVNLNKVSSLVELIKYIFNNIRDITKDKQSFPIQKEEIHINIIYSIYNHDETFKVHKTVKNFKENVYKEFNRERSQISIYSSTDNLQDILKNGNKQNVFILFNVAMNEKSIGKFFRGLMNYFKNRNLFIYQLYLENTIEQNVVTEFYSSLSDIVNDSVSLKMNSQTKEIVLKKDLLNLHYSDNNFEEILLDQQILINKENIKLNLNDFDSVFIIDKSMKIFCKNSNFFNKKYIDYSWNHILNEYFSDLFIYGNSDNISNNNSFSNNDNSEISIGKTTRNNIRPTVYNVEKFCKNNNIMSKTINQNIPVDSIIKISNNPNKVTNNIIEDNLTHKKQKLEDNKEKINYVNNYNQNYINNINDANKGKFTDLDNLEIIILTDDDYKNIPIVSDKKLIESLMKKTKTENINKEINLMGNSSKRAEKARKKKSEFNKLIQISENISLQQIQVPQNQKLNENLQQIERPQNSSKQMEKENELNIESSFPNKNSESSIISKSINNITTLHNSFNNLSVVNNNTIVIVQRSNSNNNNNNNQIEVNNINSLLLNLETNHNQFIGYDIYQEINTQLIKLGINITIRKLVCDFILKFGIDFEYFDDYTKVMYSCLSLKEVKLDTLRFYLEYIPYILANLTMNPIINQFYNLNFLFGAHSFTELQKNILIMSKIRILNSKDENEIKKIIYFNFTQILKNLISTQYPILKDKIKLNAYKEEHRNLLVNLILSLIKVSLKFGLYQYEEILSSDKFIYEISVNKNKQQLYEMITSEKNPLDNTTLNTFLSMFFKEVFRTLEVHILNKI